MPADLTQLARALLLAEAGPAAGDATGPSATSLASSSLVAVAMACVWTKLELHFKGLLGDAGIRAVLDRAVAISGTRVPWLVRPAPGAPGGASHLRSIFEVQTPEAGVAAAGVLVSEFSALLGRFIGVALVRRLLHELWPDVYESVLKEKS